MPGLPVTPTELGGAAALTALVLVVLHAFRALGVARTAAELSALALFLFLGGAPAGTLAAGLVVALACMSLAAWLWWLSPVGRSLSAALLSGGVVLSLAPTAARGGGVASDGAFLGAAVTAAAGAFVLVFSWTLASELAPAHGVRSLALRAAVATGGVLGAVALRLSCTHLKLETVLPPAVAWGVWGILWSVPALLALTGRAAVLSESLAGLLGAAGRWLPAAALLLVLASALAAAARLADPRLAVAAAGPAMPVLALLSAYPPLERWRARAFMRLGEVQDFVAVLMKPRNGVPWTPEDRVFLRAGLRSLARWAPGFLLFLLPGGLGLLGLYAWLLDRRRGRPPAAAPPAAARRADDAAA